MPGPVKGDHFSLQCPFRHHAASLSASHKRMFSPPVGRIGQQQLLSRPRCHPNAKRPNRRGEKRRLSHSAFDSTSDGRISLLVRPSKLNRFLLHPLSRSLFASIHGIAAASGLASFAASAVSSIPNSARSDNNSETERGERQGELQNDHGRRWRCS